MSTDETEKALATDVITEQHGRAGASSQVPTNSGMTMLWLGFRTRSSRNRNGRGRRLERDLALSLWFPSRGCNAGSGVRDSAELQMR